MTTVSNKWRLARVCWNSQGWTCPSGEARLLEKGQTYARQYGFGHEEWLFRDGWLIDGWQYGFLQPINANYTSYVSQCLPITLFSIDSQKRRRLVARLHHVEVLDPQMAQHAVDESSGRLETMIDEVLLIGGDPSDLKSDDPTLIFNIRFLLNDLEYFRSLPQIPGATIENLNRYVLGSIAGDSDLSESLRRASRRGTTEKIQETSSWRRAVAPVQVDALHRRIQNRLLQLLLDEYGDAVELERDFVDLTLDFQGRITLIEVKSSHSSRLAIREAVGQLLEYALYPPRCDERMPRLVVAAPGELDADGDLYLQELKRLGLRLDYVQVTPELDRLPGLLSRGGAFDE